MTGLRIAEIMPGADGRRMGEHERTAVADRLVGTPIAVVGATGAVGLEALALLAEAGVGDRDIIAVASRRSVGRALEVGGCAHTVRDLDAAREAGVVLLAVPADRSRRIAPDLIEGGVLVSDSSSAYRDSAPLVIPEINADRVAAGTRLIASPNCTTAIALTAAAGLIDRGGVGAIEIVSYQAVSGAGIDAMHALIAETEEAVAGRDVRARWLAEPAAFSVFPHESAIDRRTGGSAEEHKFVNETRSILGAPGLHAAATCVRVPTLRTHTVSVRIRTERRLDAHEARAAISTNRGVRVVDDGPTSHDAAGRCAVLVGRVRAEPDPDGRGTIIRMIAAGDQLLKGAAWNALQNAALLIERASVS